MEDTEQTRREFEHLAAHGVAALGLRRFFLFRHEDATGVSGPGLVAVGVEFPDKRVAMRWLTHARSTVVWDSIEDAKIIHGHDGKTAVVWID